MRYRRGAEPFRLTVLTTQTSPCASQLTRGMMFLKMKRAKYTGRGVKLGDAESIVYWWTPEGKETFRAIYGDLAVRNGDGKQPRSSE